jgi:hypothetical protein
LTQRWLRRLLGGLGGRAGKNLGLNGLSVPEIWLFEVGVDGGGGKQSCGPGVMFLKLFLLAV